MNYKNFPTDYWQKIEAALTEVKKSSDRDLIAAFDADGTLWDTDLGENFFNYQIDSKNLNLPKDPWTHYIDMKKVNNDPRSAYLWLAQINQQQPLSDVKKWADKAYAEIQPSPIFSEQKKLIDFLKSENVKIYIVTASIKWAVEPGARALGLTDEDVIGVETVVRDGLITNEPIFPVTYRNGKSEALLAKTQNKRPFLCSGNTIGDFELLECATHIRLAVSAASRDDRLFKAEAELLQRANELNWLNHRFV
jgi:HAD superfamily phosphoserine phosphatase-like hydrolase